MDTYKIERSDGFNNELQRHMWYIAAQFSRDTAYKVLDKIEHSIMNLQYYPFIGPELKAKEIHTQNLRVLILEKLIIFYIVSEVTKTVHLISILDQRQDYENTLNGL